MRVTQNMLSNSNLQTISNSYEQLGKYQDQLSTGKKVNRPSDDPVVATKGMFYRSNLVEVQQYKRNLSELSLWMDNSESGLDQTNSALQRVRELVLQGKNGTNSPDDQKAIAAEIGQLKEDIASVANTKIAGRYIFNGTDVNNPPVKTDVNPPDSSGINTNAYNVAIGNGVNLQANINSSLVFGTDANGGIFGILDNIQNKLNGDDPSVDLDNLLGQLDNKMSDLSGERSKLGARSNRLDMVSDRIASQEVIATQVLSDNEDIDIEKVITNLKSQESVHNAALSVGARIMQPTLMDFLR